jgi:hypothetical protein
MKKTLLTAAVIGGVFMSTLATQAATEAGTLECDVEGGVGLIVGSQKAMVCRYTSADGTISEPYDGTITKVGLDIGVTDKAVMIWTVIAPTSKLGPGALDGTYAGVSGQATVGVGASANILVGGSDQTISLQPVSVGAQTGLNVAAGIGSIELRSSVR